MAPARPPRLERVKGVSTVETWSAEVTNPVLFVRWVVQNAQYALVTVNQPALNAMARAQEGNLRIPGVKAVCTRGVRARL